MNPNLLLYQKTCPNCGNAFTAGRLNQDYCSAKCRSQFNNHAAKAKRDTFASVAAPTNFILWKNREILARFAEKDTAKLDELVNEGFQLGYITNFTQGEKGKNNKFFCYDFGYIFADESTLKII